RRLQPGIPQALAEPAEAQAPVPLRVPVSEGGAPPGDEEDGALGTVFKGVRAGCATDGTPAVRPATGAAPVRARTLEQKTLSSWPRRCNGGARGPPVSVLRGSVVAHRAAPTPCDKDGRPRRETSSSDGGGDGLGAADGRPVARSSAGVRPLAIGVHAMVTVVGVGRHELAFGGALARA